MAAPTVPIEIWAEGDVVLPNTHELNKERPIDDLWNKGWDLGEKPSCEEFNYVLNMLSWWVDYITGEQIPSLDSHFLRINQNLADLGNVATARSNLVVYSKTEADNKFVDVAGDTMTGALTLPRVNFPSGNSNQAYITTTVADTDTTYLDLLVGNSPGTAGSTGVDTMRFRFAPAGSNIFTMMELNAISNTAALCRVTGNIIASGSVSSASMTAPTATFTNGSVTNTWTVNTLQSTTTNATNVVATNNVSTSTLTTTSTATLSSLVVQNNSATVAGRNIVRSVNGGTADGNGNVTIALPASGIQDMRLGTQVYTGTSTNVFGGSYRDWFSPAGCTITGIHSYNSHDREIHGIWYRPVQKFVDGAWYTVATA